MKAFKNYTVVLNKVCFNTSPTREAKISQYLKPDRKWGSVRGGPISSVKISKTMN